MATAVYRLRTTLRRRLGGYLVLVVLVGVLGGLALAALAGARRTQSSYTTYLATTNPGDLGIFTGFANGVLGSRGYDAAVARRVAHLRYVASVSTIVGFDGTIDYLKGVRSRIPPGAKPPVAEGPLTGEFVDEDRAHLVAGRLANPASADEAVANAEAEAELGIHIGSVVTVALNSDAQLLAEARTNGPSNPPPVRVVRVRLVGTVAFPQDAVEDGYDAINSGTVLFSRALTRELTPCCAYYSDSQLKLDGGTRHLAAVEAKVSHLLPGLTALGGFQSITPVEAMADRDLRPESVALAVFGALAVLVIAGQVLDRQLRARAGEHEVLRALGAGPATVLADGLIGPGAAILGGAGLAVLVAFLASPLFPLGPVRPVYPVGLALDPLVLGLGFVALVLALDLVAVVFALRGLPHREQARRRRLRPGGASGSRAAASAGLPVTAVTGISFALESAEGRESRPVRSAILGAVVAIVVVSATITFGASLDALVAHPRLYGWNWNYALLSGFAGDEDLPAHQASSLLAHDPEVRAASGVYFATVDVDGQRIAGIGTNPGAVVQPPLLSGHGLAAPGEVVLGAQTMAGLHEYLGGRVKLSAGGAAVRLRIVGTATMPAIMGPGMGVGALFDDRLIPAALRDAQGNEVPGPNAFLVRTRGAPGPALASLERVSREINAVQGSGTAAGPTGAFRPEAIVDSRSIGELPLVLGVGLAAGAVVALGISLVASVRRRRRDYAVLRTLGLTSRQLATVVAWQSSIAVAIGIAVGVPVGVLVGRALWDAFAAEIAAVPAPSVPVFGVVLVVLGALVVANLVATVPGRLAAHTPTGLLLRSE